MTLFDPENTALVMIDLQEANLDHAPGPHTPEAVIERSVRLIDAARAAGSLVVHVRTSYLPDGSDSTAKLLIDHPRGGGVDPEGWDQLVPEVAPQPGEPVIVKRSWNAFNGSDLDLQLRRHGVDTIVLTGMTTNYGVEGTGRVAFDHFYNVVFVEDAMSAHTTEEHQAAVTKIMPRLGRVRSTDEVAAAFAGA